MAPLQNVRTALEVEAAALSHMHIAVSKQLVRLEVRKRRYFAICAQFHFERPRTAQLVLLYLYSWTSRAKLWTFCDGVILPLQPLPTVQLEEQLLRMMVRAASEEEEKEEELEQSNHQSLAGDDLSPDTSVPDSVMWNVETALAGEDSTSSKRPKPSSSRGRGRGKAAAARSQSASKKRGVGK